VVGRHRMDQRLLVVGLHPLPPPQQGPEVQTPQLAPVSEHTVCTSSPAGAAAAVGADAASADAASVELASWLPASRALSSSDAVGLGDGRYSLPAVSSDTATHILQFDGASRNNPGMVVWAGGSRGGIGAHLLPHSSSRCVWRSTTPVLHLAAPPSITPQVALAMAT
jgi:hypothetical protein